MSTAPNKTTVERQYHLSYETLRDALQSVGIVLAEGADVSIYSRRDGSGSPIEHYELSIWSEAE